MKEDEFIANAIHYPDCWDTAAYPTLSSALWEMIVDDFECGTCGGTEPLKPKKSNCNGTGKCGLCDKPKHDLFRGAWFKNPMRSL